MTTTQKDMCIVFQHIYSLRLLEFASYNDLMLANTFCPHETYRRATWDGPNGKHHNQR